MSEHENTHDKGEHGHGHGGGGGGHGGGGHHGGGGGHGDGEHEGAPEWLISFADNVTLMMGFFVIMLAMNMKPAASGAGGDSKPGDPPPSPDMIDAAIAIREGFNNPVNLASTDPNDIPLIRRVLLRREEGFARTNGVPGPKHDVESIRPSKYRELCGTVNFPRGSAELTAATREKSKSIALNFKGILTLIEIRGHCSSQEAAANPDHGMTLCFQRASAVFKQLAASGIDERQMRIVIVGDHDRLKEAAYDDESQRQNQRVEVIFTEQMVPMPGDENPDRAEKKDDHSKMEELKPANKPKPAIKVKPPAPKPASGGHDSGGHH